MTQDFRSDHNFRQLARDMAEGRCVLFLGAGVSKAAGLPTWQALEQKMREKAGMRGEYGALRTADYCRQVLTPQHFYSWIESIYKTNDLPTRLHKRLAKLPVTAFVTTNYDTLMEQSLFQERGQAAVNVLVNTNRHRWPHVDASGGPTWVLKIHGSVTDFPNGIVIGERDYLRFSSDYPHVVHCLSNLFSQRSVLFLGYSLSDANIAQILFDVHRLTADFPTNRYFVGLDADSTLMKLFEDNYGLKCLNLIRTDGDAEGAVIGFLDQLSPDFRVEPWFVELLDSLKLYVDRSKLSSKDPLSSIFGGFDSTLPIRLGLRIEEKFGIRLPLERIVESSLTIQELLDIVREKKGPPPT
jgi:acyl carrier protein